MKKYIIWTYAVFYTAIILIGLSMKIFDTEAKLLQIISAWIPTFVLLILFPKIIQSKTRREFIKEKFSEKLNGKLVLLIIGIYVLLVLAGLLFSLLVYKSPIQSQLNLSMPAVVILFFSGLIRGPIGEELGWRGYLLEKFAEKNSNLKSAVFLGLIWCFWHALLWFVSGFTGVDLLIYIVSFLVIGICGSIIITFFYRLNNNLMIPMLIHQLMNFTLAIQSSLVKGMLTMSIGYIAVAILLIVINYKNILYDTSKKELVA